MKPATQIILAGAFALIVLVVLFVIIWMNRDTDRTSGILVKAAVAPLVVAAALLAVEILSPLPAVKAEIPVVVFRDYNTQLIPVFHPLVLAGTWPVGDMPPLFTTYQTWLAQNPPPKSDKAIHTGGNREVVEQQDFFLDLFEASFWNWLSSRYHLHWRAQRRWFQGISGGGGSEFVAPDAERKPSVLTADDITRRLSGNALLKPPHPISLNRVSFPRGTEVSVNRTKFLRRIHIKNRQMELVITFAGVGGGLLGATKLAERIKSRFPVGLIWSDHIQATFDCNFSYLRRWSPATSMQREWLDEMIAAFRTEFGWDVLREKLDAAFP